MPGRWGWPLIALAGLVAAPVAFARDGPPYVVEAVLLLLLAVSFIGCGLVAWRREPDNRVGKLMILYGAFRAFAALGFGFVVETGSGLVLTAAILLQDSTILLVILLLLSFPDGRLASARERWIAALAFVALVPLELAWLAFLPPEGPGLPANALQIDSSAATADAVDSVQRVLLVVSQLALAALIAQRWRRASAARRRLLLPALVGSVALFLFTTVFVLDKVAEQVPVELVWAFFATYIAIPIAMLAGMLRDRLARGGVNELLVGLQRDPAPGELRGALARVLRDPTLEVAFWLPEYGSYADLDGRTVDVEPPGPGRAVTPIDREGRRIAVLVHDETLARDAGMLEAVAAAAGFALENARLQAELRARLDELRGSRVRILEAGQAERRRLERNLHDGAQQRLVALSLELGMLQARFAGDPESQRHIGHLRDELASSLAELRELARGLHPAVLSDHGLEIALEGLVARAPLPVHLSLRLPSRLPSAHEVAAYYLVSESLTNVAKYARATSASVDVDRSDGRLVVEVVDDGCGGAAPQGGSGLRGLADRIEALDGRLGVWSPEGGGTRVRAEIPCA